MRYDAMDDDEVLFHEQQKAQNVYVRFLIADLRSYLRTKTYNPDQPRDDYGRWTSEGDNTTSTGGQDGAGGVQLADNERDWMRALGVDPNAFNPPNYAYGSKYSPDLPGWHDYIAGPNIVCTAQQQCTREEIVDQLSRFAVPGQDPAKPALSGQPYSVYDPTTGLFAGRVQTTIINGGLTVQNQTYWNHILYDGVAQRTAFQNADGSWCVTTHGFGNNVVPGMATANQELGPSIFDNLDKQMRVNITRHHGFQKSAARLIRIVRSGLGIYPGEPLRIRSSTGGIHVVS